MQQVNFFDQAIAVYLGQNGLIPQLQQLVTTGTIVLQDAADVTRLQNLPQYPQGESKEVHELIIVLVRINDIIANNQGAFAAISVKREENPDFVATYTLNGGFNAAAVLLAPPHAQAPTGNTVVVGYDPFIYDAQLGQLNHLTGEKMTEGYYEGLCDISLEQNANKAPLRAGINNNPTAIFANLPQQTAISVALVDAVAPQVTPGPQLLFKQAAVDHYDASLFNEQ